MAFLIQITPTIQQALQAIELTRDQIAARPLPSLQAERLRLRARVRAAHFSTWLDGSRLSASEAAAVLIDGHKFPGREVDGLGLKRASQALEQIEAWTAAAEPMNEANIRKLHAILTAGRQVKASAYRPDPAIPARMTELIAGLSQPGTDTPTPPTPLTAGVVHFTINTLQPFTGSNARLARLLVSWVLSRGGYTLLRYAALEEAFAADLPAYQAAAALSELTPWLEYFTARLAAAYAEAALQISQLAAAVTEQTEPARELPTLDGRAKRVLALFAAQNEITVKDVMRLLGAPPNPARELLESWVGEGWLVHAGARYRLSPVFKQNYAQIMEQNR